MSVILKDLNVQPAKLLLYCKGADSIILDRMNKPFYAKLK
jgi:magnesium-transporting ATPase (P-type)